ncbi:hypothetical protein V5O48_003249 [Marasmius crinis-equi]|uniref:C2H2-type domain-containing protein n=1 Tax=Marasmius crinis-equi TaxID=585013 RepID=A0ABR3FTC6_9AGAR
MSIETIPFAHLIPNSGPQDSSFPAQMLPPPPNNTRQQPGPLDPQLPAPGPPNTLPDHYRLGQHPSPTAAAPNPQFPGGIQPAEFSNAAAAAAAVAAGTLPPNYYPSASASGVRLPPILQVEKQQVTTSATQLASASRRRNEAQFTCPVPGCGSTFTRRFNLRGHLRSHTEERPFVCDWPGCKKGFARQHDCKRHSALHTAKPQSNVCQGCKKTFSRLDALNRHLRSDGGAECRERLTVENQLKAEGVGAGSESAPSS